MNGGKLSSVSYTHLVEMLVEQMAEQWGVTEKLKMQDQMEWVRKMNNIRSRVVEIIDVELICV